jgi:hypothetical protein
MPGFFLFPRFSYMFVDRMSSGRPSTNLTAWRKHGKKACALSCRALVPWLAEWELSALPAAKVKRQVYINHANQVVKTQKCRRWKQLILSWLKQPPIKKTCELEIFHSAAKTMNLQALAVFAVFVVLGCHYRLRLQNRRRNSPQHAIFPFF